jgi:hypothetical protein
MRLMPAAREPVDTIEGAEAAAVAGLAGRHGLVAEPAAPFRWAHDSPH